MLIIVVPSADMDLVWVPITAAIQLGELGSKERSLNVSKITLALSLSSPLLTESEKVPELVFTLLISHLRLSLDPETKDPSLFSSGVSGAEAVALLYTAPLPKVPKVNGYTLS